MPDFGLLQSPNFAAAALGGFQAGQQLGKQKRLESALQGVDITRPETIAPLLKVDPEHGVALLSASNALLKNERDLAARQATSEYLAARYSGGASAAPGGVTGGGMVAASPTVASTDNPQASAAWNKLIGADPEQAMALRQQLDQMDEKQRAKLIEAQDTLHDVAVATAGMPYDKRKAFIQSQAPFLANHYVTPDQIAGFDPTDENLDYVRAHALGVKGVAELADKAAARAETARHNRATEGNAAGHLSLDRQREGRITKWGPQAIIMNGAVPTTTDDLNY